MRPAPAPDPSDDSAANGMIAGADAVPQDFLQLLEALGRASEDLRRSTGLTAVLVGGAAVELYTGGRYQTGDCDVYVSDAEAFRSALERAGFLRENEPGKLKNFWYLPAIPRYGVQLVGPALFDGRCDRSRLRMIEVAQGSTLVLPPVEDLIADRLGQQAATSSPTDTSALEQARLLLLLAPEADLSYLRRRILEEGGDPSLLALDEGGGDAQHQAHRLPGRPPGPR